MWMLVVGVVAAWLLLAVLIAVAVGRTVSLADRRRPRARRTARPRSALARVVELATGQIPVIRPRLAAVVTGAIPLIRTGAAD